MSIGPQYATRSEVEQLRRKLAMVISGAGIVQHGADVGDVEDFIDLADVPQTYAGSAGCLVNVNAAADGLTFIADGALYEMLTTDGAGNVSWGWPGTGNVFVGEGIGLNVTEAGLEHAVIIGFNALQGTGEVKPFTGAGNVIVGAGAAQYGEGNCPDNIIVGHDSIQYLADYSYGNVIIGSYTGASANGGLSRAVLLGYYANCGNDIDNVIVIGANASAGALSNECVIGRLWDDADPAPVTIRSGAPGGSGYKMDLWHAGTAQAITPLIRLVNPTAASEMDGTGVGMLFGLRAYEVGESHVYYDAAQIAAVAETDWTWSDDGFGENADIGTIDSYLAFYTTLNGVMEEKARITPVGNLDIVGELYIDGVQVVTNRQINAALANTPDSGDADTDALIDALRDIIIAHGLGVATGPAS